MSDAQPATNVVPSADEATERQGGLGKQLQGTFILILGKSDKPKTFQLVCNRSAVTDLLPIWESLTIQGKRLLIIAHLPRDMCHGTLMSGDAELISHFSMEI